MGVDNGTANTDVVNKSQLDALETNVMNYVKFIYRNLIKNDSKLFLIKELYFPDSTEHRNQHGSIYLTNGVNKGDITFYLTFTHKANRSDNMMIFLQWKHIGGLNPEIAVIYIFISKDKIVISLNDSIDESSLNLTKFHDIS